jgi:hypothetical protein
MAALAALALKPSEGRDERVLPREGASRDRWLRIANTANYKRDAAEKRVAELTEALNTAPEVVECECGKVTEVWTNPLRKAAASAGKEEK